MECPQCGSNGVSENKIVRNLLIGAIILFIIPIFGWIVGPIIAAVAWSTHYNMKKRNIKPMKCNECKKKFQIDKDTNELFIQKASV
jgi:hypothetical protein